MKYIIANWKMELGVRASERFARILVRTLPSSKVEVVIAPSFSALASVAAVLHGTKYILGAQDIAPDARGAFTGEVSGYDLRELGCRTVIVGHSERRQLFLESDELVARKLRAALAAKLRPVLCIGETMGERRAGKTNAVLTRQLQTAIKDLVIKKSTKFLIAYEPVWAIGTGNTPTVAEVVKEVTFIRKIIANLAKDASFAVLYGGSVNIENAKGYLNASGVDGLLVGGASIKRSFSNIIGVV